MQNLQFIHIRNSNGLENSINGGITIGYVFDDANQQLVVGISRCSPKDRFVKSIGREIVKNRIEHFGSNNYQTLVPSKSYEAFLIPYETIMHYVAEVISGLLRPSLYKSLSLDITSVSGTYINNFVVRYSLEAIGEGTENIHPDMLDEEHFVEHRRYWRA